MKLILKLCLSVGALALSIVAPASAGMIELRNGFAVSFDHRVTRGPISRLYLDAGSENYVDVPSGQIVSLEETIEPAAPPAPRPNHASSLEESVAAASYRYGVDPDVVLSLIRAESAFDPKAVSPKGAQGLMQLMPQTATLLGVENPLDAASNVDAGTRYLRNLLILYNQDLTKALAAYNAGPGRVQQFHGVPPYPETIAYINRVERDLNHRKLAKATLKSQPPRKNENDQSYTP
jgi:soluble lytic murein transglycosylase-like protein